MDELSAFLHTPAWERLQKAAGFRVERDQENLFILRPLIKKGSYWSSSRCQIPSHWKVPEFSKKAWFIRMEPGTNSSYQNLLHYSKRERLPLVHTLAVQPRQTMVLDLSFPTDNLLQRMKQKHRYNIKVAERHGVTIESHTHGLQEQYPRFQKLLAETASRHSFRLHEDTYYRLMLEELEKDKMIRLVFARKDGKDLAGLLIVTCNNVATYLHGASTTEHKEAMAPHLLHWQTILQLKEEGFRWYDFWGVNVQANQEGQFEPLPNHPSTGTTRFKLGFGGEVIEYPGTYDLVLNRFCYTLYKGIRGLRSRKRAFS